MLDRRTLLGASTALASFFSLSGKKADAQGLPLDIEPRGKAGRLERLPRLDLESKHDFLIGFRVWVNRDLTGAAARRVDEILVENGIDPKTDVPLEELLPLIADDALVASSVRVWLSTQQISHRSLLGEFHGNEEQYMAELDAAAEAGPGTLTLDPNLNIPEYTRHEIHIQPGGYMGDDFAAHCYHYSTNNFYAGFAGRNEQDQLHARFAASVATPPDGKVLRILDLGCGPGQLTVALKERFPDAEVWGIDVSAPMVRYAHMRSADLGFETHFAQALAEDTKFPDNHFDIVTSYILFHEVTAEATQQIVKEAYRVTRPGGVFYPIDFGGAPRRRRSNFATFRTWWDHRWNNERWRMEYAALDFPGEIKGAGFDVEVARSANPGFGNITGTKPG